MHGFPRRLGRRDHRLGGEVKGNTKHVGIFDVEQALFVQVVGLATQGAADHLLAEQLGAKGAYTEHMGDGVGVPALGEHGHGHHAADGLAEAVLLADRVHDLAQDGLVGEGVGGTQIAGAFDDLAAEAFDLRGRHLAEIVIQGIAGFELFAVDEQGARPGLRVAVVVEVAEQRQATGDKGAGAIVVAGLVEAGDVVEHQLGGGGVVANDDETGRDAEAFRLPEVEGLGVVAVEGVECGLQLRRQIAGVEEIGLAPSFFRHPCADMLPQVAEHGHLAAGDVVGHRHARQLDDAAFDRIHEGKIAHGPRKERTLDVAGAAQEKGRGREVDHPGEAEGAAHGFQAGYPQAGGLVVFLGLLALLALQFRGLFIRLGPVAVVGLVVEHQYPFQPHQLGHDPLQHLAFALLGLQRCAGAALEKQPAALGDLQPLAQFEGVVVGDDDPGPLDVGEQIGRHEFPALVVAVRIVGLEHAQPVADGDAGRDHEKTAGEFLAVRSSHRIDGLPGDEHGHDRGLAGTSGQFQGQAE